MDEAPIDTLPNTGKPVSNGLKVLMFSTDASIFTEGSPARFLMIDYGTVVEELEIIVYTKPGVKVEKLSANVTAHPTNSRFRFSYFSKAKYLGSQLLHKMGGIVLITSQEAMTSVPARKLARKFKCPFQAQVHVDFQSPYYGGDSLPNALRAYLYGRTLRKADCIRVVSKRIKDSLTKLGIARPVTVLPIWVDTKAIEERTARNLHAEFPQFNFIVVMACRLVKEKDVELAIRAMSRLILQAPKAGLLIVGSGPLKSELVKSARRHDVEDHVVFVGHFDDAVSYIKGADAVLVTSLYEGYGRVLVEAAAAGRAIVSTDVGVIGDILKDREETLVCSVRDAECVSDRLFELVRDNILRTKLGFNAHAAVQVHAIDKQTYLSRMAESFRSCSS